MPIRVEEYLREDGSSPYRRWFDGLEPQAAAKMNTAKLRLERGIRSSVKWFDGMGEYAIDQAKALLAEYKVRKKAQARSDNAATGKAKR